MEFQGGISVNLRVEMTVPELVVTLPSDPRDARFAFDPEKKLNLLLLSPRDHFGAGDFWICAAA